jgi:hypothetical protein
LDFLLYGNFTYIRSFLAFKNLGLGLSSVSYYGSCSDLVIVDLKPEDYYYLGNSYCGSCSDLVIVDLKPEAYYYLRSSFSLTILSSALLFASSYFYKVRSCF